MKKLIKKYTQLDGISGNEYQIAEKLFEKFSTKNPAEIYRDNLGGIACKINNSGKINIGIFAHMDEVGLMVKNIYETGDVEIIPIGGITIDFLIGQRLKFVDKKGKEYIGVVLASSPHLKDEKPKNISELRVSFGFEKREDALKIGMGKGSFLHFIGNFTEMQNNKIMTKAADNRIGVAVIEALYDYLQGNEISHNVILGATVQEEIGLKGANPLLNAVDENFDLILIVDVSPIDNYPDCKLGEGPLLRIAEPRGVYDREMTQFIQQIADKNKIKLQPYFSKGRTDGAAMQINQKGNSVAALCIPALNLHTNSTIFDLNDVNNCFELVKEILNEEFTNRK